MIASVAPTPRALVALVGRPNVYNLLAATAAAVPPLEPAVTRSRA